MIIVEPKISFTFPEGAITTVFRERIYAPVDPDEATLLVLKGLVDVIGPVPPLRNFDWETLALHDDRAKDAIWATTKDLCSLRVPRYEGMLAIANWMFIEFGIPPVASHPLLAYFWLKAVRNTP